MQDLLLCCALLCSYCRLFCALRCCFPLLQLCLLLKHLRSSAFSPFFTGFCHFRIFHTSLLAIFHTSLSPFFSSKTHALSHTIFHFSYLMKTVGETWLIRLSVVLPSVVLWLIIRQYFSSYISAGTSSLLRTSVQPLSSFLHASVLPSATSTWPPLEAPMFVGFLTFLYWVLSLSYFSPIAVSYFSYFDVTLFFFINSCAFWHYLSFLLPDKASERNVVNSSFCCSSVCFSLHYYTSILFVLYKWWNFFSYAHLGAAIVFFSARLGAAFCCFNFPFCWSISVRPLSHLSLLGFVTFVFSHTSLSAIFHLSLSPFFLHKLMRFLILSFISPTLWSLWRKRRWVFCLLSFLLLFLRLLFFKLFYVNTLYTT